jgi:hypothetical protein
MTFNAYAECCYADVVIYTECHNYVNYVECHFAECRYAECRGTPSCKLDCKKFIKSSTDGRHLGQVPEQNDQV